MPIVPSSNLSILMVMIFKMKGPIYLDIIDEQLLAGGRQTQLYLF